MKKLLFFLFPAVLFSCAEKYNIEGKLPDNSLDGYYVYLHDVFNNEQVIDSAVVINTGFRFSGDSNPEKLYFLRIGNYRGFIIPEKGTIYIDIDDISRSRGTVMNDRFTEFFVRYRELMDQYREKNYSVRDNPYIYQKEKEELYEINKNIYQPVIDSLVEAAVLSNNNVIGAMFYLTNGQTAKAEYMVRLYESSGSSVKSRTEVTNLYNFFINQLETAVGNFYVDFTVVNGGTDGETVSLSDYVGNGKYVLIDFWGSWCPPCVASFSHLKKIYEKYKGDNFDILGVAVRDNRTNSIEAINKHGIPWGNILNAQQEPLELYGIEGVPYYIILDPEGRIAGRWLGFHNDEIIAFLEEILNP